MRIYSYTYSVYVYVFCLYFVWIDYLQFNYICFSHYIIISPSQVRPGQVFRIAVNLLYSPFPLNISATVERNDEEVSGAVQFILPGESQLILLQVRILNRITYSSADLTFYQMLFLFWISNNDTYGTYDTQSIPFRRIFSITQYDNTVYYFWIVYDDIQ